MRYSVDDITEILGSDPCGDYRGSVSFFSNEGMNVAAPEGTLFLAQKKAGHDGHEDVIPLYEVGVRMFVVEDWQEGYGRLKDAVFWKVGSVEKVLTALAADSRKRFAGKVVVISGGNHKRMVKELLGELLGNEVPLYKTFRSIDRVKALPLSMVMLPEDSKLALMDVDVPRTDDINPVRNLLMPDMGIFTNTGILDSHMSSDSRKRIMDKLLIFEGCSCLVYHKSQIVDELLAEHLPTVTAVSWGEEGADIRVRTRTRNPHGRKLEIEYGGRTYVADIRFSEDSCVESLMDAVVFLLYSGFDADRIMEKIPSLSEPSRRLEIKAGNNNVVLIQDYSASDLLSLSTSLQTLVSHSENRKRCVILSDPLNFTGGTRAYFEVVAWQLKRAGISFMVGIGEQISKYRGVFDVPGMFYTTTEEFIKEQPKISFHDSAILVKGSKKFGFENISQLLQKQLHVTVLEVNLDAMKRNLEYFRSCLPRETRFSVMVKAFTYGCGGYEIASALQNYDVDYLMVAYVDEGVELRKAGITTHIGVMTPEPECFDNMIEYNLEPGIYSIDLLYSLESALEKHGVENYPVHIKLNTGMNRSGLDRKDLDALFKFFETRRRCYICSIFSHLAGADEAVHDNFTRQQLELFEDLSSMIQSRSDHKILRHILNSAGIERFPEYHYDMVRLGIGIHGISFNGEDLEPISAFKTHIVSLRDVTRDATVGYGRYGVLERDSRIAVIPVGYADGLDRRLGRGNGSVFVNGIRVPVIGNICMDACMIDVTDCEDVKVGDVVELFGNNIKLTEISQKLGTIPYEVITGISRRVLRVFYNE